MDKNSGVTHNALGQRVFKTEPLFSGTQSSTSTKSKTGKNLNNLLADDDDGGDGEKAEKAEPPGLIQQFLNFWSRLWSPGTSDAEKLGFSYVYAEDGSLLGEYGSGGSNSTGTAQYIYLPTASAPMPIAAIIKGQAYAVHSDHLNTPRKLTQADGQTAWQWAYSAFGDEQPTTAAKRFTSSATRPTTGVTTVPEVQFNLRYPGQYFDQETKLHYNWNRSYDSRTGRYTQGDPIGLDGGWHRFSYVDGKPLTNTDPSGLVTWSCTLNVFAAQAAGGGGGATISYTLKSECVRGQRFIVQGEGVGGYMALGWKVGASTSQVRLDDGLDYVNPFVFNGPFDLVTAGGSFGVGWGWSSMNLGGAHAAGSTSLYNGRDFGLASMHGRSKVSSVKLEECICEK